MRQWCLSFEWQDKPLLAASRYVRTVWDTGLAVVAAAVVVLVSGRSDARGRLQSFLV